MAIAEVDPRDVTSEVDRSTFRVYFWRTSPDLASREYEGADVPMSSASRTGRR